MRTRIFGWTGAVAAAVLAAAPGNARAACDSGPQQQARAALGSSADTAERVRAASLLGVSAEPACAAALRDVLDDLDPAVREAAASALGRLGAADAVPALAPLLLDERLAVRDQARQALERLAGTPEGAQRLATVAEGGAAPLRAASMPLLAGRDDDRALTLVAAALADEDASVRAQADRALRQTTRERAARGVAGCLESRSDRVRAACAEFAGELRLAGVLPRLGAVAAREAVPDVLQAVHKALRAMREDIDAARLAETARRADARDDRANALAVLAVLRDERGYVTLVAALKDEDEFVRASAAGGLAQYGDARAVGPLSKALEDPRNARIRRSLQRAIDRLTKPRDRRSGPAR